MTTLVFLYTVVALVRKRDAIGVFYEKTYRIQYVERQEQSMVVAAAMKMAADDGLEWGGCDKVAFETLTVGVDHGGEEVGPV